MQALVRIGEAERIIIWNENLLAAEDQLVHHRHECCLYRFILDKHHGTGIFIIKVCRASPCDTATLRLPLELTAALSADDDTGKRVLVMVLSHILYDAMFINVLLYHDLYPVKILLADNRFMVVFRYEAIDLTMIVMTPEVAVGIGFLKSSSAVVFLVHKNTLDR